MAKIENLIKNIPDPQLRNEIAREVVQLKAGKKFGLVFEEHIPETLQIPSLPVKPGLRVVKRGGKNNEVFKVLAPAADTSFLLAREPDGAEVTAPAADLVVVKKFGEPIYPTLTPIDRVTRAPGKPYHTLINADNFHALQLLEYTHAGQVDLIYIDHCQLPSLLSFRIGKTGTKPSMGWGIDCPFGSGEPIDSIRISSGLT